MSIDLLAVKDVIIGIAAVISALGVIWLFMKKYFDKMVGKITGPIINKIDVMDKNQCMNYLTEFLADVKNEVHKSEYQKARAHDVYEHYIKDLKGNSYIHEQWEMYMKERR